MSYLKKVLGDERYDRVRNSKILMVGAGGIGCELLKDLVLTGFGEIHIVDLDTITLSNLNRQFLFRQKDIDKSKALTVVQAVEKFNYLGCKLVPHHGNISDTSQFPIDWWGQFDYIYNALDNLEARRYVNKMCNFLKKPLMESGTTGFHGQIQPIYPYLSECFDCSAKVTPKTYPVCTIRSTPSLPVHCITWAKELLFQQLFDEVQTLTPEEIEQQRKQLESESADKMEVEAIMSETNELSEIRKSMAVSPKQFINSVITKAFHDDIHKLLRIDSLWKFRQKPEPLEVSKYEAELDELNSSPDAKISANDTRVWSVPETLYVFAQAIERLVERMTVKKETSISFDKDDEDTLDFVVAAANLRSHIFHIEEKSKFDIKEIAGNIIPAIATTNAIVSGFSCFESLEFFKTFDQAQAFSKSSTVFITMKPNKYVTAASLVAPNEKCPSCSLSSRGVLSIGENKMEMTLQELIDSLMSTYSYSGDISLVLGNDKLIYDCDFDDNADTRLDDINGFNAGELLLVQDDEDELENLELYIKVGGDGLELQAIELRPKKAPVPEIAPEPELQTIEKDTTMVIIDDDGVEEEYGNGTVEIQELELIDDEPPLKKQKY